MSLKTPKILPPALYPVFAGVLTAAALLHGGYKDKANVMKSTSRAEKTLVETAGDPAGLLIMRQINESKIKTEENK